MHSLSTSQSYSKLRRTPSARSAPLLLSPYTPKPLVARASSQTDPASGRKATAGTRRSRTVQELKDPAKIGAAGKNSVTVNEYPGEASLTSYMTLPVEQYFVLDPERIKHLEGSRFLISIPRVDILGAWLEPEVEICVTTYSNPPRVVLQADGYSLRGSEGIEMMRLDERFTLKFVTELTWRSLGPNSNGNGNGNSVVTQVGKGEITGSATIDVWAEVIPPFNLMPRELLQASCNVVMKGLLNSMLPVFVRLLGNDYEKWASDAAYRIKRAQRSMPLDKVV